MAKLIVGLENLDISEQEAWLSRMSNSGDMPLMIDDKIYFVDKVIYELVISMIEDNTKLRRELVDSGGRVGLQEN